MVMQTTIPGLSDNRPQTSRWHPSGARPGKIALLWLVYTALCVVDAVFFPNDVTNSAAIVILVPLIPIMAGTVGAWALGLRAGTLGLIAILLSITVSIQTIWLLVEFAWINEITAARSAWIIWGVTVGAIILAIWRSFSQRSRKRRAGAIALVVCLFLAMPAAGSADYLLWNWTAKAQALIGKKSIKEEDGDANFMPDIPVDALWEAQPKLAQKELLELKTRLPATQNIYALALAADGTQQIFSREAAFALDIARSRFGDAYRGGALLSNVGKDLMRRPLALRANFAVIAEGIGDRIDPTRDLVFIYLASHGSRKGELSTGLPNYQDITPISARSVANALSKARIKRRIIVVSACFAGSWIPALANADTIIITAAAKDRTSFGCDDRRRLTYFGEALLRGPLARGASLHSAFEAARRKLQRWEANEHLTPSQPQAYVGDNMRTLWTEGAPIAQ